MMENTMNMTSTIVRQLNTPQGQKVTEELLKKALEMGVVKTKKDWQNVKEQFILFLIAKQPQFFHVLAEDVYNELQNAPEPKPKKTRKPKKVATV